MYLYLYYITFCHIYIYIYIYIYINILLDRCSDRKLSKACLRNGYQDPVHCDRCRCKPGYSDPSYYIYNVVYFIVYNISYTIYGNKIMNIYSIVFIWLKSLYTTHYVDILLSIWFIIMYFNTIYYIEIKINERVSFV